MHARRGRYRCGIWRSQCGTSVPTDSWGTVWAWRFRTRRSSRWSRRSSGWSTTGRPTRTRWPFRGSRWTSRWSTPRRLPRTRRASRWSPARGLPRPWRTGLPRARRTAPGRLQPSRRSRLAAAVESPGQRLARAFPRRAVGQRPSSVGLGCAACPGLGRTLATRVGTTASADQLLRLQRATGVGPRLQPVGLLVLRNLDSAPVLTCNRKDGRLVSRGTAVLNSLERVSDRQVFEASDERGRHVLRVPGQLDGLQPRQ